MFKKHQKNVSTIYLYFSIITRRNIQINEKQAIETIGPFSRLINITKNSKIIINLGDYNGTRLNFEHSSQILEGEDVLKQIQNILTIKDKGGVKRSVINSEEISTENIFTNFANELNNKVKKYINLILTTTIATVIFIIIIIILCCIGKIIEIFSCCCQPCKHKKKARKESSKKTKEKNEYHIQLDELDEHTLNLITKLKNLD